jgi:branched-chain amino acid aminotransferase
MVVIYGSPVGSYFSGGEVRGLKLRVLEQGRVAPGGTGSAKTLGNYAGTFPMAAHWKQLGYDDVLFLDAARLRDVTETVASNVFARMKSGVLVTPPLDDQILPGVTRDSVIRIARDVLGIPVEERPLAIEEVVSDAEEAFCTGTAYRLKPIAEVHYRDRAATFGTTGTRDAILEILEEIQLGAREDVYGWVRTVEVEERQT